MFRSLIAIALTVVFVWNAKSQNLVSNPSFEDFYILPQNFTNVKEKNTEVIPNWYFLATPDYFNKNCDNKIVGVPRNFAGSIKPLDGNGYAGLILRADKDNYKLSPRYSEHLENKLTNTMQADQLYCCKLYISLADKSGFAVDGFGMYFSNEKIIFNTKDDVIKIKPQIENIEGRYMLFSKDWMLFSGVYKAQGNEKFMTLGNFKPLHKTNVYKLKTKLKEKINLFSYYYIDNISVEPIENIDDCECTAVSHTLYLDYSIIQDSLIVEDIAILDTTKINDIHFGQIEIGKPIELKNIYFEFDKYDLLPQSFDELDYLFDLVERNPQFNVLIEGHTDSLGTDAYNKQLSKNRAQSVVNYLISKGCRQTRLLWEGYGKKQPVASNKTEEGRQLNRRVEFTLLYK